MEYGLGIPTRGPLAGRDGIDAIATRAEALGFSRLAVSGHLIVPRAIDSRHPCSDTGAFPGAVTGDRLEQCTLLAYLAAITTRAGLPTSVAVVPLGQVLLSFQRADLERSLASMRRFADEVMAKA